jgi:hypothetical protein
VLLAHLDDFVPDRPCRLQQLLGDVGLVDVLDRRPVLAHHPQERLAVDLVAGERPAVIARHLGRLRVGRAVHDRGDRRRVVAPAVAVVRQPTRHQQRAEVGIAEAERPEIMAVPLDGLGRIARIVDQDLLRRDQRAAGRLERDRVELGVRFPDELHQVDRGQVAGRVVQEHVFRARVARIDPRGVRAGMPVVDRRVELQARIAADVRGFRDLAHQRPRLIGLGDVVRRQHRLRLPRPAVHHRTHELVGDTHAVVRVLEEHRGVGRPGEGAVIAGVDQRPRLPLFLDLAVDELLDVRMIGVQDHHLRGAPGFAP